MITANTNPQAQTNTQIRELNLDADQDMISAEEPQSTWEMSEEDLEAETDVLSNEDILSGIVAHHPPVESSVEEPSEDGSVESEMTEELFRDR
jgi:hypothetical protein